MKKTLYTFLVWNFLLFVAGLSDIVFYRNLTSVEGMTISWTQPALVSITSFLILLSIYYGMHQLLFGKNFYLKLEIKQEDIDKLRNSIIKMTKEEIISMLSKELNSEWTNGVTCLMVENSDSYIPVIVHHNKNELIVEVGEQDKKIYRIGRNELNKTS